MCIRDSLYIYICMYVCIYLPGVVAPSENESSRTLYCIHVGSTRGSLPVARGLTSQSRPSMSTRAISFFGTRANLVWAKNLSTAALTPCHQAPHLSHRSSVNKYYIVSDGLSLGKKGEKNENMKKIKIENEALETSGKKK